MRDAIEWDAAFFARLLKVSRIVRQVLTADRAIAEWLVQPDPSLGGKTPVEMLRTRTGTLKVENLAQAMVHGVPV